MPNITRLKSHCGTKNTVLVFPWRNKWLCAHHFDNLWVDGFGEDAPSGGDVVNELIETSAFHLLTLEIRHRVHEVEHDAALQQLVDKQILLLRRRSVWKQAHNYYITDN